MRTGHDSCTRATGSLLRVTGGELAGAAAKAVENLAEHAAIERRAVKAELLNAAKDSPELADAARTYAKRRWKPALNAFAITFEGRINPAGN